MVSIIGRAEQDARFRFTGITITKKDLIGFDHFKFEFRYEWNDGKYFTVECSNINCSKTIALTLNRCEVKHSYSFTPSDEDITYAKEQFNYIYEWLTEDMTRFE